MNFGVPWNVAGIRPDARETAKEAARRSGMSVGEWLNSVIDTAAGAGQQHHGQHPGQHPGQQHGQYPGGQRNPGPQGGGARDAILGLQDRLDGLSRQVDALARSGGERAAVAPHEAHGGRFASAISQFDERIERLMAEGRSAADELERRLSAFDHARTALAPAYDPRPAYRPAPRAPEALPRPSAPLSSPLDQALAEIAARQRALDGEIAPPPRPRAPEPADPLGEAASGRLAGLERQLQQ